MRKNIEVMVRERLGTQALPHVGSEDLVSSYAQLVLDKGTGITSKDVHEAWCEWARTYAPEDPSIVPYDDLTENDKQKDSPYAYVLRELASMIP